MAVRVFNNAVINGTAVSIEDFVNSTGILESTGYDRTITTQNHSIHNVRINIKYKATFTVYGDRTSLATQGRDSDTDVFGGTHTLLLDATPIVAFKGLVSAEYDNESRTTMIEIAGESNG